MLEVERAERMTVNADDAFQRASLSIVRVDWLRRTQRSLSSALLASYNLSQALKAPSRSSLGSAEILFERSGRLADARRDLAACLRELPAEDFALQGRTGDGRLLLLTRSAQRANHWQLTRFDREGVPWGDSQYSRQEDALDDFLREIEIRTLGGHEGTFLRLNPATWTPSFHRWFSGSVVVDTDGLPLEVYHGTAEDFLAFSPAHRGSATGALDGREGFFFASNPMSAEQFTWKGGEKCGQIIPAFLCLRRPAFSDVVLTAATGRAAALQLQSAKVAGHDGMVFRDSDMLGHRGAVFVAFEPQQIKSSRANSGRFDPEDPSFMH